MDELLKMIGESSVGGIMKGTAGLISAFSANSIQKDLMAEQKKMNKITYDQYETAKEDKKRRSEYDWSSMMGV